MSYKDTNALFEHLAMKIVNTINERTGASVEVRQLTNDQNFDFVKEVLFEAMEGFTQIEGGMVVYGKLFGANGEMVNGDVISPEALKDTKGKVIPVYTNFEHDNIRSYLGDAIVQEDLSTGKVIFKQFGFNREAVEQAKAMIRMGQGAFSVGGRILDSEVQEDGVRKINKMTLEQVSLIDKTKAVDDHNFPLKKESS